MTTTIKVTSHNYPALVETWDRQYDPGARKFGDLAKTDERIVRHDDGEVMLHCTTSRELRITDVEYDDPRAQPRKAVKAE